MRRFAGYVVYATVYTALRIGPFAELTGEWEDLFPFVVALLAWIGVEVFPRSMLIVGKRELSAAIWPVP